MLQTIRKGRKSPSKGKKWWINTKTSEKHGRLNAPIMNGREE